LFGTALRVASRRRRVASRERADDTLDPSDPVPAPDDLTDQKRLRELLDRILDRMGEDVRVVFVLIEVERLTAPEVSELLGVPEGTVASRLRRAREFFSAELKRIEARATFRGGRR
jgi:RNA polymerase sigma-70 factor (ECF subfamily)